MLDEVREREYDLERENPDGGRTQDNDGDESDGER
jgi:hypothetical protein